MYIIQKARFAKKAYRRKYYSANKGEALKQSSNYYAPNSEVKKEEMKEAYASNLQPKKLAAQSEREFIKQSVSHAEQAESLT